MIRATVVLTAVLVGWCALGMPAASAQDGALQRVVESPVSFRLASTSPVRGFESVNLDGVTLHVAPQAALTGRDVMSASSLGARTGSDIDLALTREGADRLAEAMRKQQADRLAIYVNGQLVSSAALTLESLEGRVVVSGLTDVQAERLTRALSAGLSNGSGAVVSLVTETRSIPAGGAVAVDVFAKGISDLRSYQIRLAISGGAGGRLEIEDLRVDGDRTDYVFSGRQKFDAVDQMGGRLGAVLMGGGVDAVELAYLGTYTLRASSDAQGSFNVTVSTVDGGSQFASSNNLPIAFAAPGIQINVGKAQLKRPSRR